ncbi:MAG: 50S ribosomal protein L16 3-hydroxylase [Candidatus Azotimanducaceae bacterium]|jgi:50S ribosomal protein L16 3-hydroxylase
MLSDEALKTFKRDVWRQKAQVFKSAIDVSQYSLSSQDICELATNELVESRLIGDDHSLQLGPFELDTSDTDLLPEGTMLLVQCLEQHLVQIDRFVTDQFSFMPRWQIDDVMASLGDQGASCGAHFDQYDVFLVQHTGSKQWQLDDGNHQESDLSSDADIRLLRTFTPTQTFNLEPGDVLYVPPGMGHFGVCPKTSITLSVGIRHPTPAELLADLSEFALEQLTSNEPMTTGLFSEQSLPTDAMADINHQLSQVLGESVVKRWYGSYVTRLKEPELLDEFIGDDAIEYLGSARASLPSRMAWSATQDNTLLFANGEVYELPSSDQTWVETLCRERILNVPVESVSPEGAECLDVLIDTGAIQVT